jgi:hypothetical protein
MLEHASIGGRRKKPALISHAIITAKPELVRRGAVSRGHPAESYPNNVSYVATTDLGD